MLRLSSEERERWHEAAGVRGMTLTGFLKVAVDEAISSRSSRVMASRIAEDLAPLIRDMFATNIEAPMFVPSPAFDRACLDADLHRPGVLCSGCGGSIY